MKKKKVREKNRAVKPDEFFSFGPLQVGRFGNRILWQNRMTETQHAEMTRKIASSLDEVILDANGKVATIVESVRRLDALSLLRIAYSTFAMAALGKRSEPEWSTDDNATVWTLEYLFSLIASGESGQIGAEEATPEDIAQISEGVKSLMTVVTLNFAIASTAKRRVDGAIDDDGYEMLYTQCVMYWCCVRKSRYAIHDVPFLRAFLAPQDAALVEVFGVGAENLIAAIKAIADALAQGLFNAVKAMQDIHRQFFERLGARQFSTPEEMRALMDEFQLSDAMDFAARRFFGDDLFNVQKQADIPLALLDELSWEPGGDREFLADGPYSGWPLRQPSVKKRPFLKIDGQYYCHLSYGLVDNVYRVLEKAVRRRNPELATAWKERQQEVSETLPISLFQKLLPGAQAIRSVRYQWPPTMAKDKNWCETDIVLTYDDHLVVGEVKAGAFTYTSPATDFSAYVESVKTLVQKPANQALRFMEYLSSQEEVGLFQIGFEGEHVEVARLRKSDWRQITICGFTLDNFTHLASRAHGLKAMGVDFKDFPFWSLAIDDLMVLADIFSSPTVFAHYLEQRQRAIKTPRFELSDEIDHIGMYLKHNQYSTKVDELGDAKWVWHGYSTDIDEYYHDLLVGEQVTPPTQSMPALFKRVIELLDESNKPGRCRVASTLLDFGDLGRKEVQQQIEALKTDQRINKRPKPLMIGSDACDMTLLCCSEADGVTWDIDFALQHARKSLFISGKSEHLLIFVDFKNDELPQSIDWKFISLDGISDAELEQLKSEATTLQRKRVENEVSNRDRGRIGRNEQCPCGSRAKYKRCCGRRS